MSKFSVVTPVYNAERFIERGLKCLFEQTYSDFEVIAIDDGSEDRSGSILDSFAKIHKNLKVYHKQNEGVGKARNDGLKFATSDYIYFMDIDDLLEKDFFTTAIDLISRYNQPDLLVFGFKVNDGNSIDKVNVNEGYIASRDDLSAHFTEDLFKVKYGSGFLWNKLYKRDILEKNHIRFGTYRVQEDELFNIDYIKCTYDVALCNQAFYTYFLDNGGNSRSKYIPNMLDILIDVFNSFTDLKSCLKIIDKEFDHHLCNRSLIGIMNWVRQHAFHPDNHMSACDRVETLKQLRSSKMWRSCIEYKQRTEYSIEAKLYMSAISISSPGLLKIYVRIYSKIRQFINIVKHA